MMGRARSGARLAVVVICLLSAAMALSPSSAAAASSKPTGSLHVVVAGLPPGQGANLVLHGPAGSKRTLRGVAITVRGLAPGHYRIDARRVRIARATGGVHAGAVAQPLSPTFALTVRRRHTVSAKVEYGSIVNPEATALPTAGFQVIGSPHDPRTLSVAHGRYHVGQILLSGPTSALPDGLVARIASIQRDGQADLLHLQPVPVTEAVPVIDTGGSVATADQAKTLALLGLKVENDITKACGLTAQAKLSPVVRLSNMDVDADINANPFSGGPKADLVVSSDWTFGFTLKTSGGVYCKKELAAPQVPFAIPVGPVVVPAYVALPVTAKISLSEDTDVTVTYSWKSEVGMRTRHAGPLLIPTPVFSVSNPSSKFTGATTPKASVEGDVDLEAGVGARTIADISMKAGTALEAALQPGKCYLDWKLGNFSAGGKVGPVSIGTPDFSAFTHRIWSGCGGNAGGPGNSGGRSAGGTSHPAPPPSPVAPPVESGGGLGSALDWQAPHLIYNNPPYTDKDFPEGVSCPTPSFCAAVDEYGQAITSTDPGGGPGAWSTARVSYSSLRSISCPSASFCFAAGGGPMVVSTNPGGGAGAWQRFQPMNVASSVESVSCASASLCVAVGNQGDVLSSTDPTGGPGAWNDVDLGSQSLVAVSCPTASLCVAVDLQGQAFVATDPTGPASAWQPVQIGGTPTEVDCPATNLCVVATEEGQVIASTSPTNPGSWFANTVGVGDSNIFATNLSCPTASRCYLTNSHNQILTSTEPGNPAGSWTSTEGTGSYTIEDLDCPTASFCVALDSSNGRILAASAPLGGAAAWSALTEVGFTPLTGLSCPTTTRCVAVSAGGDVIWTPDPAGSWNLVAGVDPPEESLTSLTDVSCPTANLCVAVDQRGHVLTSTDPTGGPGAWTKTLLREYEWLTAVDCPSSSLCVATSADGTVWASTDPTGGAAAWSPSFVGANVYISDISCPTASYCVAVDNLGEAMVSSAPAAVVPGWKRFRADPRNYYSNEVLTPMPLLAVSCSSPSFCAAVDGFSGLITSIDPGGGPAAWNTMDMIPPIPEYNYFQDIDCPTGSLCAAVGGGNGDTVWSTTEPAGGVSSWLFADINGEIPYGFLEDVSCPTATYCVALSGGGHAFVGTG
jgi:hypothetical protein